MDSQMLESAPLLARKELWLLISAAYVDPYHRERFDLLRDCVFRQRTVKAAGLVGREYAEVELGSGEVNPKSLSPERLFAALDAENETIEATYRQLFGLTAISQHCPPCEIEYESNPDVAFRSQRLADVAGFYQAFGLQVSPRVGERLDHITVEAEFLYLMLAKEAAALQVRNQEGAGVSRDVRLKFFQEHVGWWLPAFSRVLSRIAPAGYYKELATLTAGMSALERASLGLPRLSPRIVPKPSGTEAQAACFECVSRQHGV